MSTKRPARADRAVSEDGHWVALPYPFDARWWIVCRVPDAGEATRRDVRSIARNTGQDAAEVLREWEAETGMMPRRKRRGPGATNGDKRHRAP